MDFISVISISAVDTTNMVADKHGNYPVKASCVAGKMPNRLAKDGGLYNNKLINGTIAERGNLIPGNTALVQFVETERSEYGREFNIVTLAPKVSPLEMVGLMKELGSAFVVNISITPDSEEATEEATEKATEE